MANPTPFSTAVPLPIGVAADPTHLFVSRILQPKLDMVDCNGNVSLFGTLPARRVPWTEKYLAIAPSESAAAGFTPGDLFVTQSQAIFKASIRSGTFTLFATLVRSIGGCPFRTTAGLRSTKWAHLATDMIVTCENGRVFRIDVRQQWNCHAHRGHDELTA